MNLLSERVQQCIDNNLTHEIHTSERKSFRACRRRWDWAYRQGYYPVGKAKPLEFGIAYHVAMETYYNPNAWSMSTEVKMQLALKAFVDECEKQRAAALKALGGIDAETQADYDERVTLGRGMIEYYFTKVAPIEDVKWTPVKVEIEFQVPIPNVETGEEFIFCKCDSCWKKQQTVWPGGNQKRFNDWLGLPVTYSGRLDMLAKDEYNNYWIFDWKTASALTENKEFLLLDDQIGTYIWALRKLGLPVTGFVYHEQRKGFPQAPKLLSRGSGGRLFSVSKTQETDYKTYFETISRQDIAGWGGGAYDDFLEYLKNDGIKFHDRREVHKTNDEVLEIENNVSLEALDMIGSNVRLYPAASKFGCNTCAYRQPCIEKNARNDYKYALDTMFVRGKHYYEEARMKSSTDSKVNS